MSIPSTSLQLILKAKQGDPSAFEAYLTQNEGLLQHIVSMYDIGDGSMLDRDDLLQEAVLGLRAGIDNFNENFLAASGKPEGYVFSWVRAYVSRYVRKYGISKNKPVVVSTTRRNTSEDNTVSFALEDVPSTDLTPEQHAAHSSSRSLIQGFYVRLPHKRKIVMQMRLLSYPDKVSLREVGRVIGVSHERVRQIEVGLKTDLLNFLQTNNLITRRDLTRWVNCVTSPT